MAALGRESDSLFPVTKYPGEHQVTQMCGWRPKRGEPLSAPMASSSLSGLDQETLAELLKSAMDQGAVRVESSSPASAGIPGPFAALAAVCHRFSEELAHDASVPFPAVLPESVEENLEIIQ